MRERSATKIKAPTLYPRDSEIKKVKSISEDEVLNYYRAQRVHQNNVEANVSIHAIVFSSRIFFKPTKVAIAGAIVWIFRLVGGIGYLYGQRMYGAPWHLGELYLLYIVGYSAYELLLERIYSECGLVMLINDIHYYNFLFVL